MPQPLYSQGRAPETQSIGGWLGPTASLDTVAKRKIPPFAGNQILVFWTITGTLPIDLK